MEDVNTNSASNAVAFSRVYNSLGAYASSFGNNWDHNLNVILLKEYDANGDETGILYKAGDGALYRFTKDTDGSYVRPVDFYAELSLNNDGLFELALKNRIVYAFNESNQLAGITDAYGRETLFEYSLDGNLTKVQTRWAMSCILPIVWKQAKRI